MTKSAHFNKDEAISIVIALWNLPALQIWHKLLLPACQQTANRRKDL